MDSRLETVQGRRPMALLKKDLPPVAKAIVLYSEGTVLATQYEFRGVPYVSLVGAEVDIAVVYSDWFRILPWIENGYFSAPIYPASVPNGHVDRETADPSNPTSVQYPLYLRTLEKLQELFPKDYPISNL